MKGTALGLIVGLALGVSGMWLFSLRQADSAKGSDEPKEETKEHGEAHAPNRVTVNRAVQSNAGLQTAAPEAIEAKPEIKGYGRVLDPAPLMTALLEIDTAQAALTVSSNEHARVHALFDQNRNASLQSLQTAEAAMRRDQLLLAAGRMRLMTGWSPSLAERTDLAALAQSLVSFKAALVRLDLLPGQSWEPPKTKTVARLASLNSSGSLFDADLVGPAPSVDPQTQGLAFLFLLRTNPPPPGTVMLGYLPASTTPEKGWRIPTSALIRHEGAVWVYAQIGDETFERLLLSLERPLEDGWFVLDGVVATNQLVVRGAQTLLSEQLKGAGGEE